MLSTQPPVRRTELASAAAAALQQQCATLAIWAGPFGDRPDLLLQVPPGPAIAELLPAELAAEVVVCRYCGQHSGGQAIYVARADWQREVQAGDLVEFHVRPQGGDGGSNPLRIILTIALIVVANVYAPYLTGAEFGLFAGANTAAVAAGIQLVGSLAINALLPVASAQAAGIGPATSPSYNVSLSGNAARLDGAIPVLYGYNRTFPDFAGQPYVDYDNDTSDQYYYALLALGHGDYTVPRIEIDDTPLSTFADVEFNILEPGDVPTLVDPAVVSAPEVTGQELTPGRYVGAFAASGPRLSATHLGFDIVLGGLGVINNDGSVSSKTVTVRFEARPIDDWGAATGAWVALATVDITAASASAVRRSYKYALPSAGRYLARVVRTSAKDESRQVANTPQWAGLRAYLDAAAPLEPSVTHIEIRMRASEQLNGLSQRKIAVTSLRKLHTWAPGTGWSASPVETRNPAWALADKMKSSVYGDGLPDSRIDLASLHALAATWDARQDRCDVVFDAFTDSDTADQLLAGAGRARVIRRNGVRTVVRDEAADLPVTAYTSRMMRPGSWGASYGLPTSESADGVILEYWSNRSWDWEAIECPAPGRTYTDPTHPDYDDELPMMSRPVRQRVLGITGETHARREGTYMAAKLVYRRRVTSWATELQGILPAYGSAVVLAPALPTWGQAGDVVSWVEGTRSMGVSEPLTWTPSVTHGISLVRDDGSLTAAIEATAGADAYTLTLATVPDFDLVLDSADRERPRYVFGPLATHRKIARMLAIEPAGVDDEGTPIINLTAVIEDDRVHEADEALLPEGEEVQDPINLDPIESEPGGGGGDGGGATLLIVELSSRTVADSVIGAASATFTLSDDGHARIATAAEGTSVIAGQWLLIAPTILDDTELFEARATLVSGSLHSGTTATWLPLDTSRSWVVVNSASDNSTVTAVITVEIRDVETDTVQSTATITLSANSSPEPGGA